MKMFIALSEEEAEEFRRWARENYEPFSDIKGIWHPEVQKECARINGEAEVHTNCGTDLAKEEGD